MTLITFHYFKYILARIRRLFCNIRYTLVKQIWTLVLQSWVGIHLFE